MMCWNNWDQLPLPLIYFGLFPIFMGMTRVSALRPDYCEVRSPRERGCKNCLTIS